VDPEIDPKKVNKAEIVHNIISDYEQELAYQETQKPKTQERFLITYAYDKKKRAMWPDKEGNVMTFDTREAATREIERSHPEDARVVSGKGKGLEEG